MIAEDVLLDRVVDDETLAAAIGESVGLDPSGITIVSEMGDAPGVGQDGIGLVVQRVPAGGDYPLLLEFFPREGAEANGRLDDIARLCGILRCACLVTDDSDDPSVWLRVLPDQRAQRVRVDTDALDRDEFVVRDVLSEFATDRVSRKVA